MLRTKHKEDAWRAAQDLSALQYKLQPRLRIEQLFAGVQSLATDLAVQASRLARFNQAHQESWQRGHSIWEADSKSHSWPHAEASLVSIGHSQSVHPAINTTTLRLHLKGLYDHSTT